MKKLLIILFGLFSTIQIFAKQLNYDQVSITPETWEEVDLTYTNTIDGKDYTEHANLLRPISWIKHNHLDKVGTTVHLTKEQLGIDTTVKVIAIKPTTLNYSNNNPENPKPVIATFITHSNNTWDYTFKDQNGNEETIHSVSDHPFYSADRQAFMPIGQFKTGEQVKTNNGMEYLNSKYQNNNPKTIYNVEVYQVHNYRIGHKHVLVHNPYCCRFCQKEFKYKSQVTVHELVHTGERLFPCPGCEKKYKVQGDLTRHMRTHTGEKAFKCEWPECGKAFTRSDYLTKHMWTHTRGTSFPCTSRGCGQVFTDQSNLNLHVKYLHQEGVKAADFGTDPIAKGILDGNIYADRGGVYPSNEAGRALLSSREREELAFEQELENPAAAFGAAPPPDEVEFEFSDDSLDEFIHPPETYDNPDVRPKRPRRE